jgi:hypothetical protein
MEVRIPSTQTNFSMYVVSERKSEFSVTVYDFASISLYVTRTANILLRHRRQAADHQGLSTKSVRLGFLLVQLIQLTEPARCADAVTLPLARVPIACSWISIPAAVVSFCLVIIFIEDRSRKTKNRNTFVKCVSQMCAFRLRSCGM